LYKQSFLTFDKKTASKEHLSWLSVRKDNVIAYKSDPLCGFLFTNQGFVDLSYGIVDALDYGGYQVENQTCKLWFIVGSLDVTCDVNQIQKLVSDFNDMGYHNIQNSVIEGVAHEVLFDENKHTLWRQVADFIDFSIR
jgi:alpha-beta hydrolase superfamily lysophospholipase